MAKGLIVVSWSEIDSARQCPLKHYLEYKQRWQREQPTAGPLARGTLFHEVLAAHYRELMKRGSKPKNLDSAKRAAQAVLERAWERVNQTEDESYGELVGLVEWMYAGYVNFYGVDEDFDIVAVEHTAVVPLLLPGGKPSGFGIKIKVDAVFRMKSNGRLILVDHKSHNNLPGEKELDLDDQFPIYEKGLSDLGKPVFCSYYNAVRSQRLKTRVQDLKDRHARYFMARTPRELDNIAADVLATVQNMHRPNATHERHPNPDTCRWRCGFTDPCITGRKYGEARMIQHLRDLGFAQDFQRH